MLFLLMNLGVFLPGVAVLSREEEEEREKKKKVEFEFGV